MKLQDLLYFETDDSCALCGIRGDQKLTEHHLDGNSSNNVYDNMLVLCYTCHIQYHNNKGISAEQLMNRKRHLMMKTITQYGINALKLANRNPSGIVAIPFLIFHLIELGYLSKAEEIMNFQQTGNTIETQVRYTITEKGQEVFTTWFK